MSKKSFAVPIVAALLYDALIIYTAVTRGYAGSLPFLAFLVLAAVIPWIVIGVLYRRERRAARQSAKFRALLEEGRARRAAQPEPERREFAVYDGLGLQPRLMTKSEMEAHWRRIRDNPSDGAHVVGPRVPVAADPYYRSHHTSRNDEHECDAGPGATEAFITVAGALAAAAVLARQRAEEEQIAPPVAGGDAQNFAGGGASGDWGIEESPPVVTAGSASPVYYTGTPYETRFTEPDTTPSSSPYTRSEPEPEPDRSDNRSDDRDDSRDADNSTSND